MKKQDAFSILSIQSGHVTPTDIKAAYRKAAAKYHPDHNPAGLEMMKLVNMAYEVLKDFRGNVDSSNSTPFKVREKMQNDLSIQNPTHQLTFTIKKMLSSIPLILCIPIFLSGCLTNEYGGALAGGIAGSLIGNQFGHGTGRTAATIAGGVLGGWMGNQWGRSIDERETQRRLITTRQIEPIHSGYDDEYYPPHPRYYRYNGRAHVHYARPYSSYPRSCSRQCRKYESAVWVDGEPQKISGRSCFINGKWRIID